MQYQDLSLHAEVRWLTTHANQVRALLWQVIASRSQGGPGTWLGGGDNHGIPRETFC